MTLDHVLASPAVSVAVERLGWVLAHSLWQFAAVAAVAAAALAVLRRSAPTVRHGVLVCSLLAMAALPMVTWGLVDVAAAPAPTAALPRADAHAPAVAAPRPDVPRMSIAPAVRPGLPADTNSNSAVLRAQLRPWLGWCVAAWLAGVAARAVRPLVGWLAWRRLVAAGEDVPAEVVRLVERACRRLGVSQSVKVLAAAVRVPAVTGWLKPVMLVPVSLLTALPPAQLPVFATAGIAGLVIATNLLGTAQAHELPKDTNTIVSLTPEQARKLAEEFPGVEVEIEFLGSGKSMLPGCLPLNGLKSLDGKTAKAVAEFKGLRLLLNGLTSLDADTAKALAAFKGQDLYLGGLTSLDADTAKALAAFEGQSLLLNGLTSLDADTAKALAELKGESLYIMGRFLYLDGLTSLDADTAKALAEFKVGLNLSGLTTLDAEAAKALAEFKGERLYLNRLTSLSREAAQALAQHKGPLSLDGLATLDADTAKALTEFKGPELLLNGLTTLDADTAKALAAFKGQSLLLRGLTTLDPDTAKAIAEFKGQYLGLEGLTTIDAEAAKALAESKVRELCLYGLTSFESSDAVAVAQALATRKGRLWLPHLKKISPKTLTALIEKQDVDIPLIETLELIPEPDGSQTDDFVIPEWLKARQRAQQQAQ